MRTLAIGDMHGCITALRTLVDYAGIDESDRIVTLGDYVDRGPDTRGVLDWVIERFKAKQLIPLRGNHEVMMLESRRDENLMMNWLLYGGHEALLSYGKPASLDNVPDSHWRFIEHTCRGYYETDSHIFVHGNLYPEPRQQNLWVIPGSGRSPSAWYRAISMVR